MPVIAAVSENDIFWASAVLGLPAHAFTGVDGNDPRMRVLRSNDSIDVAACPGSGKTTLLVAKLAILARRWPYIAQGVCVLSHTNVARIEIEQRLANDSTGRTILSYPHYIGTIHGFINTFIALPYLKSQGIPIVAIDDDICCHRRWFKLSYAQRNSLERNGRTAKHMRIEDALFGLGDVRWGSGTLGRNTPTYRSLVDACRNTTNEGYHCHDDMLIWAEDAIEHSPQLVGSVRRRFPYLFLDEVQDNSERQSRLLHRIFSEGDFPVKRQRFGDMNQAIYGHRREASSVQTDPFPQADILIEVPNSHRFGQQIAESANPVALVPPGLIGLREHNDRDQTAVLLFDPNGADQVLPAYARLLIDRFNEQERQNAVFAAIGAVRSGHNPNNPPNCVAHYWSSYDPSAANIRTVPTTFLGYVRSGIAAAASSNDLKIIVNRVAEGLIRLAIILNPTFRPLARSSWHRQVQASLAHEPTAMKRYSSLAWALATGHLPTTSTQWERWKSPITDIATVLLQGAPAGISDGFLDWVDAVDLDMSAKAGNFYAYPPDDPLVRVKVGTIHSVKGETHMATLVLDTHYYGSHLLRIKDWLVGRQMGLPPRPASETLRASLKQHYVAMTRPSHFLCVAMRTGDLTTEEIQLMQHRHWRIGYVGQNGVQWRE